MYGCLGYGNPNSITWAETDYEKFLKSQSETMRDTGESSYHKLGRRAIWDRDPIRRRVEVLSRAAQALVSRYRTRDPLQDLCVMSRRRFEDHWRQMLCLSDPDLHVCVGKVDITLQLVNWIHKTPANKWYFMWNLTSGIVFCSFESVKLYFCFMLCWVICSYDCGARGRQSAPTPGRWAMTRASVNCVMCGVWDGSLPQIDDEFTHMWGPSCTEVQCLSDNHLLIAHCSTNIAACSLLHKHSRLLIAHCSTI